MARSKRHLNRNFIHEIFSTQPQKIQEFYLPGCIISQKCSLKPGPFKKLTHVFLAVGVIHISTQVDPKLMKLLFFPGLEGVPFKLHERLKTDPKSVSFYTSIQYYSLRYSKVAMYHLRIYSCPNRDNYAVAGAKYQVQNA